MSTLTARRIDADNYLIVDESGAQVAITDAAHVSLFVAAPAMRAALLAVWCPAGDTEFDIRSRVIDALRKSNKVSHE